MTVVFFIPLVVIALVEAQLDVRASLIIRSMYDHVDEGEEDDPKNQDPETDHEDGMVISRVPFDELVKAFPNSYQVRLAGTQDRNQHQLTSSSGNAVDGVLHPGRDQRSEGANCRTVCEARQKVIWPLYLYLFVRSLLRAPRLLGSANAMENGH